MKLNLLMLSLLVIIYSIFLIGCSSKPQIVQHQPPISYTLPDIPEKPKLFIIEWKKVGDDYCVNEEGAKKLYLNVQQLKVYSDTLYEALVTSKKICEKGGK